MPVCKVRFIDEALQLLKDNGVQIVVTHLEATRYLHEVDLTAPTAFVMGNEEKGVSPAFVKLADEKVRLPMSSGVESFNVSVATGMVLYEAIRQRLG